VYLIHTITYEIKFNAIKSAERFSGCLRVLIYCLMPTFHERCIHFIRAKSNLILIHKKEIFFATLFIYLINKCVDDVNVQLREDETFRRTRSVIYGKGHKARNRGENNKSRRERVLLVSTKAKREENGIRQRGPVKLSLVPWLVYFLAFSRMPTLTHVDGFLSSCDSMAYTRIIYRVTVRLEHRPMS